MNTLLNTIRTATQIARATQERTLMNIDASVLSASASNSTILKQSKNLNKNVVLTFDLSV